MTIREAVHRQSTFEVCGLSEIRGRQLKSMKSLYSSVPCSCPPIFVKLALKPSIESCLKAPKLWLLAIFFRRREAGGDLMRLQWIEEMLDVVDVVEQSCVKWVRKSVDTQIDARLYRFSWRSNKNCSVHSILKSTVAWNLGNDAMDGAICVEWF